MIIKILFEMKKKLPQFGQIQLIRQINNVSNVFRIAIYALTKISVLNVKCNI